MGETYKRIRKIVMFFIVCACCFCHTGNVQAADPVIADIPVECVAEGIDAKLTYTIKPSDESAQKIENEFLELKNGQKGNFKVEFYTPDTYHFTVAQRKGNLKDVVYDETVYTVDVYVTEDDEGIMHTKVIAYIKDTDEKQAGLRFVNERKATPTPRRKNSSDSTGGRRKTSDTGSGTRRAGAVKTGDVSGVIIYAIATAVSLIALIAVIIKLKKETRDEK